MVPNRDKASGVQLKYVPPINNNGQVVVKFSIDEVQDEVHMWENSVIVYVLGAKPPFVVMKAFVERKWTHLEKMELYLLKTRVYVVSFADKNAQGEVIEEGPWTFDGKPLIVRLWTPNVSLEREGVTRIPLWIRFPGLKLYL